MNGGSARFFLVRLLVAVLTLAGISVVVFSIIALAPGDPFSDLAASGAVSPEILQDLRQRHGLDAPLLTQYVGWAGAFLRGDWGYSQGSRIDVQVLIAQRLPTTLFVMGTAYLMALLIAVPVGVISAVRQYSLVDHIVTLLAFIGNATPTFFTGMVLMLVFSYHLRWLPTIYPSAGTQGDLGPGLLGVSLDVLAGAVLPIAVLALAEAAQLTRYIRSAMLDVIRLDYVTTARAKGLSERRVLVGHALRTALLPVVTILALHVPNIFTGAIVTEQIFRVPGIGALLIGSLLSKDTPVVMAIVFSYAILAVVCSFVADVAYGLLDPRIRLARW